jgi:chaperonin GroES
MEVNVMKLKPMADNILLKQNEAEETTSSGIILATTNKEKPAIYEVVSAGPGTKDVEVTVKPGDKVVVSKFSGNEIKLDGVDYKFVKQEDILAVVFD